MRPRKIGFWYRLAVVIIKPALLLFTRHEWRGQDQIPRSGGLIVAANHVSLVDPLVLAEFVIYGSGRIPRFLAKSSLFAGNGLVGRVMRGAKQIPVHRGSADASLALKDAVAALHAGECIVIYPEGTVSRDPQKWPMVARTGIARLALLSGVPVVPVAQWGAEEILDSYRSKGLHLLPRHKVRMLAGPPVDLSGYAGKELSNDVLRAATGDVMAAVTRQLEVLRGQSAPAEVYDPQSGVSKPAAESA